MQQIHGDYAGGALATGQNVTLDLYEGMPHIFQYLVLDAPESKLAIGKTADFKRRALSEN